MNKIVVYEAVRFCVVGVIATAIHYFIYWLLMQYINTNFAYTAGYAISFVCNFFLTSFFTFKTKATVKKGLGFGIAHLTNYLIQLALLNLFIYLGIAKTCAPFAVFAIAIPINFVLIRFVFKK